MLADSVTRSSTPLRSPPCGTLNKTWPPSGDQTGNHAIRGRNVNRLQASRATSTIHRPRPLPLLRPTATLRPSGDPGSPPLVPKQRAEKQKVLFREAIRLRVFHDLRRDLHEESLAEEVRHLPERIDSEGRGLVLILARKSSAACWIVFRRWSRLLAASISSMRPATNATA